MVQKMRSAQDRPVSSDRNHQIHVGQVLPIQLYAVYARKRDVVGLEDREEGLNAFLVGSIARLETRPS